MVQSFLISILNRLSGQLNVTAVLNPG